MSSPTTLTTKLFAAATQEPDKRLRTRNDGAARPTNREIFLQMVDAMNDSMHGEVRGRNRSAERCTFVLSVIDF